MADSHLRAAPLPPLSLTRIPQGIPPLRVAAIMAVFYLVVAGAYILISSSLAGEQAASVKDLERVEILKGMVFVVATALVMFGFNYVLLARIQRDEEQIALQRQMLHQGEAAVLAGVVATTIAHDINNTLTVAVMSLEDMRSDLVPGSRAATLADNTAQALEEIGTWNQRLFDLGGCRVGREISTFDLIESMRRGLDLICHHPTVRQSTVTSRFDDGPVPFRGHEAIVQRALLNLVMNAAEATGPGGAIDVRMLATSEAITIEVHDNGPGIPAGQREAVLRPFHTTKPNGTGLGLSSVVACAQLHEGEVTISDSPLGGVCFVMTLRQKPGRSAITLDAGP